MTFDETASLIEEENEELYEFLMDIREAYHNDVPPSEFRKQAEFITEDIDISSYIIVAVLFGQAWRDEEMRGEYSGVVE